MNISLTLMKIPTAGIGANKILERKGQRLVSHVFLQISQEFKALLVGHSTESL